MSKSIKKCPALKKATIVCKRRNSCLQNSKPFVFLHFSFIYFYKNVKVDLLHIARVGFFCFLGGKMNENILKRNFFIDFLIKIMYNYSKTE